MSVLNREIERSPFVYAEQPVTLDERRAWLAAHQAAGFPVYIAEDERQRDPLGWGSLSQYRAASGYRFTVEPSVYVAESARGRGVGRRMLSALHDAALSRGAHASVASIDAENAASIALFERFGYREVARLPDVGWKQAGWRTQLLLLHRFG